MIKKSCRYTLAESYLGAMECLLVNLSDECPKFVLYLRKGHKLVSLFILYSIKDANFSFFYLLKANT